MNIDRAATGIGWFSIGLGLAQLLAPRRLGRAIGVGEHPVTMRVMGLRELASGIGVLTPRRQKQALWARVAGDAMDATMLAGAMRNRRGSRGRLMGAVGAVLLVGALDYMTAKEKS